ncbi:hypothetical protein L6R52_14600 [Myxococcota bacterium]|nr:hypothetical protein [Myxococcota bacterium]
MVDEHTSDGGRIIVEVDEDILPLVDPYLVRVRASLAGARRAALAGDVATVRKIAHDLMGTGASYGFDVITSEGRNLHGAALRGDVDGEVRAIDAIERQLGRIDVRGRPAEPLT